MKKLNKTNYKKPNYPLKIIQFGEGNFLRAFTDWMIHTMNKSMGAEYGIVVIQPISDGMARQLNEQDGLYTLFLNGYKNGKVNRTQEVIQCIKQAINPYQEYDSFLEYAKSPSLRFVISNTTEAGIAYHPDDELHDTPQISFPGKLTAFLYRRYQAFDGASDKGLIVLPCELIDNNGVQLENFVLQYAKEWQLEIKFIDWIKNCCSFCNTLVDRIVPGYPKNKMDEITRELGYVDNLVVEAELFHLWAIEGPKSIAEELPLDQCGLNVVFTDKLASFRTRKVRILNGAHIIMVPIGLLYGLSSVLDFMQHKSLASYITKVLYDEICPSITSFSKNELHRYVEETLYRFKNPYIDHKLESIALNAISKFKTRVVPSIISYSGTNKVPPKYLSLAMAALMVFYKENNQDNQCRPNDSEAVLEYFKVLWTEYDDTETVTQKVMSNRDLWNVDLGQIPMFETYVASFVTSILDTGIENTLNNLISE